MDYARGQHTVAARFAAESARASFVRSQGGLSEDIRVDFAVLVDFLGCLPKMLRHSRASRVLAGPRSCLILFGVPAEALPPVELGVIHEADFNRFLTLHRRGPLRLPVEKERFGKIYPGAISRKISPNTAAVAPRTTQMGTTFGVIAVKTREFRRLLVSLSHFASSR
jgi:hypothetical protein